jgi:nicotinamidase-related amidase
LGVQVIHNVAKGRADGKGGNHNARMFVISQRHREAGGTVTDPELFAQVVDQIGVEDEDILVSRIHGMSPMTDTGLDSILRNLGVTTVVIAGVSVNVGVTNLAMDAMNRSYDVVVARDCCAGVPATYVEDVMRNTLANIAWVLDTDDILDQWSKAG